MLRLARLSFGMGRRNDSLDQGLERFAELSRRLALPRKVACYSFGTPGPGGYFLSQGCRYGRFRPKIMRVSGFDSIRILFSRGEIPPTYGQLPRKFDPKDLRS